MSDFEFLKNPINGKWVISAPRRSHRTNAGKIASFCPFCPGAEIEEEEVYKVPSVVSSQLSVATSDHRQQNTDKPNNSDWSIRVVRNKFPFAPHHEVIIHSPDHHKSFDELPISQVELILQTYRQRFNAHKGLGQVYLFNNSGLASGASLTHPHTQLVVVPQNVKLDIAPLDQSVYRHSGKHSASRISNVSDPGHGPDASGSRSDRGQDDEEIAALPSVARNDKEVLETEHFLIFCPATSEWPDEVWIAPKQNGGGFGFIKNSEIKDLAFVLSRLIQIFDHRHGHEFPFNFYIYPGKNWYLRLIPRTKTIGGFELGTNIIVNTQAPSETFAFIKEHFHEPDLEKIRKEHQADYRKQV